MNARWSLLLFVAAPAAFGCATVSPPFDQMKTSQMTVYRLQNFEAPTAAAGASPIPGLPPIPPQVAQMGNDFLQKLGLPGMIPAPGAGGPGEARFPTVPTPGYPTYRILQYRQVADVTLRQDIATFFGTESNFTQTSDSCMYPELGFAIQQPHGGPAAEIVVSGGCKQVRGFNFQWPYAKMGMDDASLKKLADIVSRVFAGT